MRAQRTHNALTTYAPFSSLQICTPPPKKNDAGARQVYTPGKRLSRDGMGTDWYEGANVETDRVLEDFIHAITPSAAEPGQDFKWLRRLDGAAAITYVNPKSCASVRTCGARRPQSTCANAYWSCADGTLAYGSRNYHCRPPSCLSVSCWCCGSASAIGGECAGTCRAANRGKCPR